MITISPEPRSRSPGISDHDRPESPFVKDSKFNGKLTLGEQIHFLAQDERVRNIVVGSNFNIKEVLRCASRICNARNKAAHPDRSVVTESDVRDVRNILRDGLGALFPERPPD